MTEDTKRGPKSDKPADMQKMKLKRGYVPSYIPDTVFRQHKDDIPKAAVGSIIEVPEAEAQLMVLKEIAVLAFPSEELAWITPAQKRETDSVAGRKALVEAQARHYAAKMAALELK